MNLIDDIAWINYPPFSFPPCGKLHQLAADKWRARASSLQYSEERTDERAERKLFPQINAGRPALFLIACERTGIANGSNLRRWAAPSLPPAPPHTGSDVIAARWRTEEADSAPLHAGSRLWHSLISELRPERHVLFLLFKLFTTSFSNTNMQIRPLCFNWEERT